MGPLRPANCGARRHSRRADFPARRNPGGKSNRRRNFRPGRRAGMNPALLLSRSEVAQLLTMPECIDAVEKMFRQLGDGQLPAPGILGIKSERGGLHIKAGLLPGERDYIVAKLNTNYPRNPAEQELPTIQELIMVADGSNGRPLAVMDSIDIPIKRTAA